MIGSLIHAQTTDWVKSFGGVESDKGISIGTDSLGFIYVSGYYNTSADFGGINLTNNNPSGTNKEMFIMKMDSFGTVLWAIAGGDQSGSCCDDRALGMHVTPGGDVFITGTFWSSYDIGSCSVSGNNQLNAHDNSVLAKVDKDGNCVWVIGFGGDNTSGGCPYPIYDADDPNCSMWMVFDNDNAKWLKHTTSGPKAVVAMNGIVVSGL